MSRRALDEKIYTDGDRSALGGVVSTVDRDKLAGSVTEAASEYAVAENAYPAASGRWVKRKGYESVLALGGAHPVAMRKFVGGMIAWVSDGSIWQIPFTGAPRLVKASAFTPGASIAHEEWQDVVYWSDGTTGLWEIDHAPDGATAELRTTNLNFFAQTPGADGNLISIALVDPAAASRTISVSVAPLTSGPLITVGLATDAAGALTSTAQDVADAVTNSPDAAALVTAGVIGDSLAVVAAMPATNLSGGAPPGSYTVHLTSATENFSYLAARTASERLLGVSPWNRGQINYSETFDAAMWSGIGAIVPGGEFTAMIEVGRTMVLAQAERMFRIDGTDPTTWNVVSASAEGLGCIAPNSICEVEGVVVYYSPRGLAFFDGAKARPLSDQVFDANDPSRSLLPTDLARGKRVFTVVTQDHVLVFYPSSVAVSGCDRALAYNFRRDTWGGPYTLGAPATCGDCELAADGAGRSVHLGTADGHVMREYDGYQDNGVGYTFKVRTRDYHFGTVTLDKVYREARIAYEVGAASEVTVKLLCDDEASPREGASRTFTEQPGNDARRVAIRAGVRARKAALQVEHSANCSFELAEEQVDAFFCRLR